MRLKRPSSRLRSLATRNVYFPFDRASHRPSFKQDWRFHRLLGIYVNSFLCASQDKPVIGVLVLPSEISALQNCRHDLPQQVQRIQR